MFLYGMNTMADGMQRSAGGKMKKLLGYLTSNRLLAIIVGAVITAIIKAAVQQRLWLLVLLMRD